MLAPKGKETLRLTVAAENPVYVEGNYNACTNNIDQQTNAGTGVPRRSNRPATPAGACGIARMLTRGRSSRILSAARA